MKDEAVRGATYELVIRGELDSRYRSLFEGLQMERVAGTTVLTGTVRDSAQLYGFIERVEELGLELLSVRQATESGAELPSAGRERE